MIHCIQVDRNYIKPSKGYCTSDFDYEFVNTVKDWMYSFAIDIESKQEEEYSFRKLQAYISDDKIVKPKHVLTSPTYL